MASSDRAGGASAPGPATRGPTNQAAAALAGGKPAEPPPCAGTIGAGGTQTSSAAEHITAEPGPAAQPVQHTHTHDTRHRPQQQQQQLQQAVEPAAASPLPASEQPSRQNQHGQRTVRFAPGPLEGKYRTQDGHPDHEGQLARQRRSLGLSWGLDLTVSSVRALESGPDALGEECQPSLTRLKRRVGLLPLRKRPREYLTWMLGEHDSDGEDGGAGDERNISSRSKSTSSSSKEAKELKRQQQQQQDGSTALPSQRQQHLRLPRLKAGPSAAEACTAASSATQAEAMVTFSHKHAALQPPAAAAALAAGVAPPAAASASAVKQHGAAAQVARGSRRLGGLAGPIGSIRGTAAQTLPAGSGAGSARSAAS